MINKLIKGLIILAVLFSGITASAVTISFSAAGSNGLGDIDGNDLPAGSLVQLGTIEGNTFTVIDSSTIGSGVAGLNAAFAATTDNLNTIFLGIAGKQLAIRSFDGLGNSGIFWVDMTANPLWMVPTGDGSGLDTATTGVDLGSLTNGSGTELLPDAQMSGTFFPAVPGTTFGGTPNLNVVPEPSTYAVIFSALIGVFILYRRCK